MPDNKKIPEFPSLPGRERELSHEVEPQAESEHSKTEDTFHDTSISEKIEHIEPIVHSDMGVKEVTIQEESNDVLEIPVAPPKAVLESLLIDDIKPGNEYDALETTFDFSSNADEK